MGHIIANHAHEGGRVWDPDQIASTFDLQAPARSEKVAVNQKIIREFAKKQGVKWVFDVNCGIGGHQDTAAGAKLTIIAQPLLRGRIPCVTERVHCVTTPGEVIDAVVTEYGITINPGRKDLLDACSSVKGLPLVPMDELADRAKRMSGPADPVEAEDRVAAVVEWRDGTVIDTIRQLKKK